MTEIFEKHQSSDSSNYASSSGLCEEDKEIGYRAATSKHRYVLANNSALKFIPIKIDLNCARMVRVYAAFLSLFRFYLDKLLYKHF